MDLNVLLALGLSGLAMILNGQTVRPTQPLRASYAESLNVGAEVGKPS